ncbi:tRNA pseudouridine(55) synthase TruB [Gracilibacillus sp. YIM 98692]|uniref:tRNA pseudouridine(55) synthase TruB n=1 Tax=Gracilibacillus sp. YIM 98692 TaxID=2663532 RepID=UPI0013D85A5F|nr:tRNA pseudouridine(55) synthase TruB [Gracilibacillus sp. YIM 98692]
MNGILPIWKPRGMTSHDCVIKVRKSLKTKKVGHTGTLDPEVEGVLPICVGEATKLVPFLTDTNKGYQATLKLGQSTITEDQTGEILDQTNVLHAIDPLKVKEVMQEFIGKIQQRVPLYSAVKVNGRKLYDYARAGEDVERPIRQVYIHELQFDYSKYLPDDKQQEIQFYVICSKGTYIRTLCVDIGKRLGYPAHMSHLIRSQSGPFQEHDTISIEKLENIQDDSSIHRYLRPLTEGVSHLDKLVVDTEMAHKVKNGQKFPLPEQIMKTDYFRLEHNGILLAIYQVHENKKEIKPVRVFKI